MKAKDAKDIFPLVSEDAPNSWNAHPIRPLAKNEGMTSGDILVSHPISMLDPDSKIFDRSVIMVVNGVKIGEPTALDSDVLENESEDESEETVVLGLITNQALDVKLGELGPPDDDFTKSIEVFRDSLLYRGGPMMLEQAALSILHTAGEEAVPESARVGDHDLWLSANWQGAAEAVHQGKATVDQFRFYLGFCLWEQKHLGIDIERHSWFPMQVNSNQLKAIVGVDGLTVPTKNQSSSQGSKWSSIIRSCSDVHFQQLASFPEDPPSDTAQLVQEFTDGIWESGMDFDNLLSEVDNEEV